MKQQITLNDLDELTESQRRTLNELWMPKPFEWAVAYICRDVEEDRYEPHGFVIGGVSLSGHRVYLTDLRAMLSGSEHPDPSSNVEEEPEQEETGGFFRKLFSNAEEDEETGPEEGEPLPDGWDSMGFDAFPKEDCLPILTLGQLIELLQKLGYGEGSYCLGVGNSKEMSWADRTMPGTYEAEYEGEELCDVLWTVVKTLLK